MRTRLASCRSPREPGSAAAFVSYQTGAVPTYPLNVSGWAARPELDLFSAENRTAVRSALAQGSGAAVFGWHYFFAGGSSRDAIAFTDIASYEGYLERARPGDHLTLFDLDAV